MSLFQTNFSLKNYNTFGIDAKAKYFVSFDSICKLKQILSSEVYQKNKHFILGGGSNILLTKNFDGLIIHNKIGGIYILEDNSDYILVEVGAGVNWHDFVIWSVGQKFSGIENLALIPGTVGASPVQNIGAYGMEVKDTIQKVTTIELETQNIKSFNNSDCKFEYRTSIFKQQLKNQLIITKVEFKLSKTPLNKTTYGAIKKELEFIKKEANPQSITEAVTNIRNRKLPNPSVLGNSGSFFKNPIVTRSIFEKLKLKFPEIVGYTVSPKEIKIAAGWLIENAGLKGFREGDAGVHKKQALVLVNYGTASGQDIINLSQLIQKKIKDKYGITILPEVYFL